MFCASHNQPPVPLSYSAAISPPATKQKKKNRNQRIDTFSFLSRFSNTEKKTPPPLPPYLHHRQLLCSHRVIHFSNSPRHCVAPHFRAERLNRLCTHCGSTSDRSLIALSGRTQRDIQTSFCVQFAKNESPADVYLTVFRRHYSPHLFKPTPARKGASRLSSPNAPSLTTPCVSCSVRRFSKEIQGLVRPWDPPHAAPPIT